MNSSVTKIPCNLDKFFKYWLQFTAPLHKLQNKEIKVLSFILKKRYELSYIIADDEVIDSFLFSTEVRDQIVLESGESKTNFSVILSKLRSKEVILENNKINKKFIPNIGRGSNKFDLMIIFDITNDTN